MGRPACAKGRCSVWDRNVVVPFCCHGLSPTQWQTGSRYGTMSAQLRRVKSIVGHAGGTCPAPIRPRPCRTAARGRTIPASPRQSLAPTPPITDSTKTSLPQSGRRSPAVLLHTRITENRRTGEIGTAATGARRSGNPEPRSGARGAFGVRPEGMAPRRQANGVFRRPAPAPSHAPGPEA